MYVNKEYFGKSAAVLTKTEAIAITGDSNETTNDLRNIGTFYYLPGIILDGIEYNMNGVNQYGKLVTDSGMIAGIRPVVKLEDNVTVKGKGPTHNTYATRWTLTKNQ